MVRVSKQVWQSFEFNLGRAKALALAHHYLEILIEEGETAMEDYLNAVMGKVLQLVGFDFKAFMETIREAVVGPVQEEISRQLGGLSEEELEARVAQFEGREKRIEQELKDILEPFLTLQLLAEQTLIESAVVLTVAAYEAFLREVVAAEARRRPSIIDKFPEVQKQFTHDALRFYGRNARVAQAELLARSLDAHHPHNVKSYFSRIYGIENIFRTEKLEREVYRLIQARHVIVHRGGFVDRDFKRATKSRQRLGERVHLPYRQVLGHIETVGDFGELVRRAKAVP